MKSCALISHSPFPFPVCWTPHRSSRQWEALRRTLIRLIEEEGVTHFISGMEQGGELDAAELVLALKERYPNITLECAIPFETQSSCWQERLRDRYFSVAERCDKETLLQTRSTPDCMDRRDCYMKERADIVLDPDGTPLHPDIKRKSNCSI